MARFLNCNLQNFVRLSVGLDAQPIWSFLQGSRGPAGEADHIGSRQPAAIARGGLSKCI